MISIDADMIMARALKKDYEGILLAGGPPCQPFSSAGLRGGWADTRSSPTRHFCHLRRNLIARCHAANLRFASMLEQVATMSAEHRDQVTELFGAPPVLLQAGDFGWVQRARFYWGAHEPAERARAAATAEWEFKPAGTALQCSGLLRWCGPQVPEHWIPSAGWTWPGERTDTSTTVTIPGELWKAAYSGGRFATLTTAFKHPPDHGRRTADDEQLRRFDHDDRRFPLHAYAKHNCVTKGDELRVLNADERESIMGYPAKYTATLRVPGKCREDARCHAIGNGFHIPSVALVLAIILHLPVATGSLCVSQHVGLARSLQPGSPAPSSPTTSWRPLTDNTEFDRDHDRLFEHRSNAKDLLDDVCRMFPLGFFPRGMLRRAQARLQHVPWERLACWKAWTARCRPQEDHGGPDLTVLAAKWGSYVATGRQKNLAGARDVPASRIPADISMQEHQAVALGLDHPFLMPLPLEADAEFAVDACSRLGPDALSWRYWVFDAIRKLARSIAPLDEWALSHRPTRHCKGWAPVLTAAFIHLLDWRDRTLPWALVAGFAVVGEIPPSGIHRPLEPTTIGHSHRPTDPNTHATHQELRQQLLGQSAKDYVDMLESKCTPHEHAEDILELTNKEIELGLARPLETRSQIDEIFGPGEWRPLPRHVIHQHGKPRPIDDAKASSHNANTKCSETIVCTSAEWPALITREVMRRTCELDPHTGKRPPAWLHPRTGTADMWKGFRQNHPTKEDERFCVVTFIHPHTHRRVYSRLRGLPFGMGSVVNQFNRLPHLQTAVKRRLFGLLVCHYFDDELLWEIHCLAAKSYGLCAKLSAAWGIIYSDDKRQPMSALTDFLGCSYDWPRFLQDLAAGLYVKESTLRKACGTIQRHQSSGNMTPAEASKLRGLLSWVDKGVTGRALRGALTALVARQYWEKVPGNRLTSSLLLALEYAYAVLYILPPRLVRFQHRRQRQRVLYTDASTDGPTGLRLGIWMPDSPHTAQIASYDVPPHVISQWRLRTTYIGQGELLAVPVALSVLRDQLRGCMVTWYIDNTSAASAAIKGSSPEADNSPLALLGGLLAAALGVALWVEHVYSGQNPSDVMTHAAFGDPAVQEGIASGALRPLAGEVPWGDLTSLSSALELVEHWAGEAAAP